MNTNALTVMRYKLLIYRENFFRKDSINKIVHLHFE